MENTQHTPTPEKRSAIQEALHTLDVALDRHNMLIHELEEAFGPALLPTESALPPVEKSNESIREVQSDLCESLYMIERRINHYSATLSELRQRCQL